MFDIILVLLVFLLIFVVFMAVITEEKKKWETPSYKFINTYKHLEDKYQIELVEQPKTIMQRYLGKRSQTIHTWQFGHGETKETWLWLKNLPELKPTNIVEGRENLIWKMPPSKDRQKLRSKTYPGIAKAIAEQWTAVF